MARTESRTKTSIWRDDDFRALSARAQRMYWLLYSQPTISLCGVVAVTARRWASTAHDETPETVQAALDELSLKDFVLIDWTTEELFVLSFVRHDGVGENVKLRFAAWRQLDAVSSPAIKAAAGKALAEYGDRPSEGKHQTGIGHTSNGAASGIGHPAVDNHVKFISGEGESFPIQENPGLVFRARAQSQSPSPTPTPSSSPCPPTKAGTGATHEAVGLNLPEMTDLAARLAKVCKGDSRRRVEAEAADVTAWALTALAPRVLEEAIGWAEDQDPEHAPNLPRAVASVVLSKARDSGIPMKAYQPK